MIKEIANIDEYLYHYTNELAFSEKILYSRKIRFGKIENTNDPKEYFGPNY